MPRKTSNTGHHKLQRLINQAQPRVKAYLETLREELIENSIEIRVGDGLKIKCEGDNYPLSGYFDETNMTLAVAIKKPMRDWLGVLIHEHNHMRQFVENRKWWDRTQNHYNIFWSWVAGETEMTPKQALIMARKAAVLEADCERRALETIEEQQLSGIINPNTYAQKANAYINFYLYMATSKSWYKPGKEPYSIESVWKSFPTEIVMQDNLTEIQKKRFALCV